MKKVFTTGQVAKICKVAPRTVSKWFDSGRLRGYRIPGSQDRPQMIGALAKILRDLTCFDASKGHVDDDAIGVKALSPNPRFEPRGGRFDTEVIGFAEMIT